ncbi:hypothetical protein C8R46DRAFT_1220425 [Mycena filopes]|nr:hypothetical protein C8R46DRAFT_1220425 [Mycena filopes]
MAAPSSPLGPLTPSPERNSPMQELRAEYSEEKDDQSSLESRVNLIVSKKTLLKSDIMDRGLYLDSSVPIGRFALETGFSLQTESTIRDMQYLLDRAARLRTSTFLPHKATHFMVDPNDTLMTVLKNAMELSELNLAWIGLNRRMELARRNFDKYESEFQATKPEELLLSPVSTDPELYGVFPRGKTFISDVNYLFNNVPHLQTQRPREYREGTDWLPNAVGTPVHLSEAFPDRVREGRPATVYYSAAATRGPAPARVVLLRKADGIEEMVPNPERLVGGLSQESAKEAERQRTELKGETPETLRMTTTTVKEKEDTGAAWTRQAAFTSSFRPRSGCGSKERRWKRRQEVPVESLPEWDGDHSTAIDYFWEIGQVANLLGWMPMALGFWLPSRLKKGSQVQLWFSTLSSAKQAEMRSHYLVYLQSIKDNYLGKRWQLKMNMELESQSFRQEGHEKESPQVFLGRRIRYLRLLAKLDEGGPMEVFLIMQKAPISWSTIIVVENVKSTGELYERVNEHEQALVEVFKRSTPNTETVTMNNLSSVLRRLGFSQNNSQSGPSNRQYRRANLAEADEPGEENQPERVEDAPDEGQGDETIRQVYQILKKRQRAPPKGGYPFPKNDHVTTKMGKAPPSPCKVCGSPNHWDKECPDWNVYLEKQRRGALLVMSAQDEETEMIYHNAYVVLLDNRLRESF